jgi:hypothetical protein
MAPAAELLLRLNASNTPEGTRPQSQPVFLDFSQVSPL